MAAYNKWNVIQDIIENRDYRNFYYFYNENHENTYFSEKEIKEFLRFKSKDDKSKVRALRTLIYYNIHLKDQLEEDQKIVLLTDSASGS